MTASPSPTKPRVLVAGLGYSHLGDLSLGPELAMELAAQSWPEGVEVEDLSHGPVSVMYQLQEAMPPYDRLVLVAAVQRERPPGSVVCYRWDGALPDAVEIQNRVEEAVTGVISLDNLLIVTGYFGALPEDVVVIEVEPERTEWGEQFSPRVAALKEQVLALVRHEALAWSEAGVRGRAALGGWAGSNGH